MFKVKVGYSLTLTYPTLEKAERATKVLFEGGVEEVAIKLVSIEESVREEA